ncbi:MAG TPA: pentapeptide repeat-containing protein [Polyangiaceae bacterium]|nr:pentapeptide repeat-containing protein [Polyangiaceae bacterium]
MDHRALTAIFDALERRRSGASDPISLPESDLQGALLLRADLVEANLERAKLDMGNLSGAKLGRARLGGASMRSVHLDGADLTEANLDDCVLDNARVRGACFSGATLLGASIRNWVGVPDSLAGAKIDKKACERSQLDDKAVIELFRGGVEIVDLDAFSEDVRRACVAKRDSFPDELTEAKIREAEATVRKARLEHNLTVPPASRRSQEMQRLSIRATVDAPGGAASPSSNRARKVSSSKVKAARLPDDLLALAGVVMPPERAGGETVLGGYELVSVIGHGSSGTVWRAKSDAGEEVAVKLFDMDNHSTGLLLHAFRRGVKTMNRLVLDEADVDVLRMQAVGTNLLGFVTDYARNGNVSDLPALGWTTQKVVDFFIRVCMAVDRAHSAGILHRCLKPTNILLDDDLKPLLTDFDIVDLPTLAAASDDVGGYAPYSAPEEILDASTMSPTADIFSLGKILAFLISGEEPDPVAEEVPALDHLRGQPAGLTRIIRKCTLRNPAVRYQVVSELISDLLSYEDYEKVGIAGGALETNFMPYRISSLPAAGLLEPDETLRFDDIKPLVLDRPAAERKPILSRAPGDLPWLSRESELRLATVGGALILCSVVALVVSPLPGSGIASAVDLAIAGGLAMLTFALPRFEGKIGRTRIAFAAAAFITVFFLSPGRLTTVRLRSTLNSGDTALRGRAVKLLTARGVRQFDGADLENADLSRSELTISSFRNANLKSAKLDAAMFNESSFDGADLTGATARGTDFYLANPDKATGWNTVKCDEVTRMPQDWACVNGLPKSKLGR